MNRSGSTAALLARVLGPLLLCLSITLSAQQPEDDTPSLQAEALHWQQVETQWRSQLERSRADLSQVQLGMEDLEAHIMALAGSVSTYRVLQEQKAALPRVEPLAGLSEAIAELRLRQFELIQQRRQHQEDASALPAGFAALQQQLQTTLETGITLQSTHAELLTRTRVLLQSLQEQLFWVPSNPPLDLQWWRTLPEMLWQRLTTARPDVQLWPTGGAGQLGLFSLSALLFLAALVTRWQRPRLLAQEQRLNQQVVDYYQSTDTGTAPPDTRIAPDADPQTADNTPDTPLPDPAAVPSPWQTPLLLISMALRQSPISLLLIAAGLLMPTETTTDSLSLGPVLIAFGFSLFVVRLLLETLRHPDISFTHFGWSASLRQGVHQFVSGFAWVLLPTTVVVSLAQQQTVGLSQDRLSALVLMASGVAIAWLSRRLLRQADPLHSRPFVYWALHLALVVLPLGMVILTALGYVYTVLQLTNALLATFYILTVWTIAGVAAHQGLALATETLRRHRAIEEAEHARQMAAVGPDEKAGEGVKPLPQLDIDKVTQQSGRLSRFLILLILGGLLFWIWQDMLLALGNLEFGVVSVSGDLPAGIPFNLLDLLTALAIAALTLFFAANLPGLLEMVILSRLHLRQGSAYATTTLLNYLILGVGLIMALSALGVSWDRLQWLVAALSVGLGFGLQEIFANFVSGLIILFERPIRIGDVVTLGNLSGRVRQIRIRATTITDFDRKDIIVPNKTFVTGQLINWSLTDTVTRVTIRLGVAYGSDLERTRDILLAAADENDRVLKDPKPQVLFLNFGDSALDHELRIHVRELGDRNPAIDEINRYVDQAFKEAGIEISFQQVDIRLRNSEGLERLVEQRPVHKS
ncbi:mechanosensitive ion channel domain-containing protein [Natronospirillum operosum]|nr:mechanosensitive ion channel domain-containing protein [Natronospirillum operosum]